MLLSETDNVSESEADTEGWQRASDAEPSPNRESNGTESEEEDEDHDATMYVSFCFSERRIHTGRRSETMAQIEDLTLNILEQIVTSLTRRNQHPAVGTRSHRQTDGKVEIRIADRRKDMIGG